MDGKERAIMRVFPRRTRCTPDDDMAVVGSPTLFSIATAARCDEIHISVTFTDDIEVGSKLAREWGKIKPTRVGGPALGLPGQDFIPGKYLKTGYVITSRGCPNRCWFCDVWKRERGIVRELPIMDGWNVLDDNLLACSDVHIGNVFTMLKRQKRKAEFTGGLEANRLQPWHIDLLVDLAPRQVFFAYDTADDLEPLRVAGDRLCRAGFTWRSRVLRAYVLIGYPGDALERANTRLLATVAAGFLPMAMLYRRKDQEQTLDSYTSPDNEWRSFQRLWARPAIIMARLSTQPLPIRGTMRT